MLKFLLTIFIISVLPTLVIAQNDEKEYGYSLLRKAGVSFCNKDTSQTIKILASYIDKFPSDGTAILVSKNLADLYLKIGNKELAIKIMENAIDIRPEKGFLLYKDSCGLFKSSDPSSIQADICVSLSQVYRSLGDSSTALKYLNLADSKYLPKYGGCANGMIMYKTKLSLDFADHFLSTGDTAKAIDRLIEFFLSNESYEDQVTAKLKSILLLSYSQQQITTEINKGIKTISIIKDKEDESNNVLRMTFFGRTIEKRAYGKRKSYQDFYSKHRSILTLIKG